MDLRPAEGTDYKLLLRWREEGETAPWYQGRKIDWRDHAKWLIDRLRKPRLCKIWIAEVDGEPIGQARIDSNGEISYYVAPEYRELGYGTQIVQLACQLSGHHRVKASVDGDNEAGIRTLLKAGFVEHPDVKFFLWRPS